MFRKKTSELENSINELKHNIEIIKHNNAIINEVDIINQSLVTQEEMKSIYLLKIFKQDLMNYLGIKYQDGKLVAVKKCKSCDQEINKTK